MKRPPKENRDGSKTIRLYCAHLNQEKNDEVNCYFAMSFKYVAGSRTWIVNDVFSVE